MQANFAKHGEIVVVELKGRLDFETSAPFRRTCLERLVSEKVVFDLRNLSFVGSLGLKEFVNTLEDMTQNSDVGVRFCGVSSEFRRMFDASEMTGQDFFETRDQAISSFT